MTNSTDRRLLQKALDHELSAEERRAFLRHLDDTPDAAESFNALKRADRLLSQAPFALRSERAPSSLAVGVMARLALAQFQPAVRADGLALAFALLLVTLIAAPMLVGLMWLALSHLVEAALSGVLIVQLIDIARWVVNALLWLAVSAREWLAANPMLPVGAAAALLLGVSGLGATAWQMRAAQARS